MENCIDIEGFNARRMIIIKEPGSTRHPTGQAIKKIEMSIDEAIQIYGQLAATLDKMLILKK